MNLVLCAFASRLKSIAPESMATDVLPTGRTPRKRNKAESPDLCKAVVAATWLQFSEREARREGGCWLLHPKSQRETRAGHTSELLMGDFDDFFFFFTTANCFEQYFSFFGSARAMVEAAGYEDILVRI